MLNAFLLSNAVKNSLSEAMKVFKLPLWDIYTRQSEVLNQLALSPFSKLGLALGKGSLRDIYLTESAIVLIKLGFSTQIINACLHIYNVKFT